MRIRILKPDLVILEKTRAVGDIVNDPDPNECANLVRDGRAEFLTAEEDADAQAAEDLAAESAQHEAAAPAPDATTANPV